LTALSIVQGNAYPTLAGAALTGSLLAFLLYNFPPASIFLGDTGSMFLGFALAMMSLMGAQKSEAAVIMFAPMLALGFPVFETLVSIVRRYVRGVPIFAGDNAHTHHRLLRKGYSQPQVVLTLCGTGLLLAVAAITSALIPENSTWVWCPYAIYLGILVNIAWLAGYLRPTAFKTAIERRQRNKVYHALARYATLHLNANGRSSQAGLLLELCRQELGLRYMEVEMASRVWWRVPADAIERQATQASREKLRVKSSDGHDVIIWHEFDSVPDDSRRQDVYSCLAAILDGMKFDQPGESTEEDL
jgi:hypothetical protein